MTGSRGRGPTPWNRLPGALADSLDTRCLVLAALGLLLSWLGARALLVSLGGEPPTLPVPGADESFTRPWTEPGSWTKDALRQIAQPYLTVAAPFVRAFRLGGGNPTWWRSVAFGLWELIAWGLVGAAIARVAVVRAADDAETVGLWTALRFSLGRMGALLMAPFGPFLTVALLTGICALIGLAYQGDTSIGRSLAGALGFVPVFLGIALALILVGFAAGWPLMVLTVAAEGEDAFDAVSRSYSYVGHRPLTYAIALAVCGLVGLVGTYLVTQGTRLALHLATWALAFGAPDDMVRGLYQVNREGASLWARLVWFVVAAWPYSYFWCSVSRIYLLLRYDVDGAPWEDVYLPHREPENEPFAPPSAEGALSESNNPPSSVG